MKKLKNGQFLANNIDITNEGPLLVDDFLDDLKKVFKKHNVQSISKGKMEVKDDRLYMSGATIRGKKIEKEG